MSAILAITQMFAMAAVTTVTPTLGTRTKTESLPTGTETHTLPTRTETFTHTLSATMTQSLSETLEPEFATSFAPASFYEGEEVRMKITATWTAGGEPADFFNSSNFELKLVSTTAETPTPSDCSGTTISTETTFGVSDGDRNDGKELHDEAYVTFIAAPASSKFIVCYQFTGGQAPHPARTWQLAAGGPMQSMVSKTWYRLPEATAGQYAILQLVTMGETNFTISSSGCSLADNTAKAKCDGDHLKLVPAGMPCTYEHAFDSSNAYYGSDKVNDDGSWKAAGYPGFSEGSTAGGVARFGTDFLNPMFDSWDDTFTYTESENATIHYQVSDETVRMEFAYAYVRLPTTVGAKYDVCYSGKEERRINKVSATSAVSEIPMWRKLYRCTSDEAECQSNAADLHFTVLAETVGWSMLDLTPGTWGEIVFDDSGADQLSSVPAIFERTYADYWAPAGGDYFRILPESEFGEEVTYGSGSNPSRGCWRRWADGVLSEEKSAEPEGSNDLMGDPTDPTANGDATAQSATYSRIFVPDSHLSKYYVCYRKVGSKNSGMRVLPFHFEGTGSTPAKWQNSLGGVYNETMALVPGYYLSHESHPTRETAAATWYMNDTREETYGPLLVEMQVHGDLVKLDSRAWNFATKESWAEGETVFGSTQGSALRLVKRTKPCDYDGFKPSLKVGAENMNGGMVECNNAHAITGGVGCDGTASDLAETTAVAFYVRLPEADSYRVCYRLKGWNWRELQPTSGMDSLNDPTNPQPGFGRRSDWDSSAFKTEAWTRPTLTVVEQRAGMHALFLVSDDREELSAAGRATCTEGTHCESSGDVLRLVQKDETCSINSVNWNADLADTYLSVYCPVSGSGTAATSGLSSTSACSTSPFAMMNCGGEDCSSASDKTNLGTAMANMPTMFDDVVPGDYELFNTKSVAALLKLPAYNPTYVGSDGLVFNQYKVCYKQTGKANWMLLDTPYEWEVSQGHQMTISPSVGSTLLGGELQKYVVTIPEETATESTPFYAKLVRKVSDENDGCLGAAGSTEASMYSGSTKLFKADSSSQVTFYMTTPHLEGDYHLCMQFGFDATNHTMSWWNPGTYSVKDNGLRWYVTSGNQPTNNGLINVNFIRCSFADGACDTSQNLDSYDTSPEKDAAKIVAVTDSCNDGDEEKQPWGESSDVGVKAADVKKGSTDLGPADGPSDVAILKTVLPSVASDAQVEYKVCMMTTFPTHVFGGGVEDRRWVEVAQASGVTSQLDIKDPDAKRSSFYTEKGLVDSWTVDAALNPVTSLFTGADAEAVAFAGASTQFVTAPDTATPTDRSIGFHFHTYSSGVTEVASSNIFKLVLTKKPAARLPTKSATWGDVSQWASVDEGDCDGPAFDSTTNTGVTCEAGTFGRSALCPTLGDETSSKLEATFHIPILTGEYKVCYKVQHTSIADKPKPWLWLPSKTARSYGLFAHPSFLEVEVDSSKTDLTAFDTRVVSDVAANGAEVSLSSWCSVTEDDAEDGKGIRCSSQNNGGYTHDLFTVVNGTQICPAPSQAPKGSAIGEDEWFTLQRASNVTATVWNTWGDAIENMFVLPPANKGTSGQYKICVYKAGEALPDYVHDDYAGQRVTKKGVVYQLFNRGSTASGGDSGFWRDTSGAPAKLIVERPTLEAQTGRFIEYTDTLADEYGDDQVPQLDVTDPTTGKFSRSVLFTSGSTVRYVVRTATTDGVPVAEGSYTIDVKRCPSASTFAGLFCGASLTEVDAESNLPFLVVNQGACLMEKAATYGWPSNGLRQSMVNGVATFELQYRSACPDNEFGCGVRFFANDDQLFSPAQWVNIQPRLTTSLTIDELEVESTQEGTAGSHTGCGSEQTLCYLKTCWSEESCTLNLRSRWMGPEYAPNGTIAIHYSETDYPTNTGADVVPPEVSQAVSQSMETLRPKMSNPQPWVQGGTYSWTFTPKLNSPFTEKHVFLNLTFGEEHGSWARVVVRVARRIPMSLAITSIVPRDTAYGLTATRVPSPGFRPNTEVSVFTAVSGSYLDALTPYRMYYSMSSSEGVAIARTSLAMDGWKLTAKFDLPGSGNVVLGITNGMDNYLTSPAAMSTPVDSTPRSNTLSYYVDFRVYVNDNECSRFKPAGGCEIEFTLKHTESAIADLKVKLITPVRVTASTLKISTDAVSNTVREGIWVTALPGTQMTSHFVYDEFHYGDIFALLNSPAPASGATNRDGVTMLPDWNEISASASYDICAYDSSSTSNDDFSSSNRYCDVYKYPTKHIEGTVSQWGAKWKMIPSKPCYNCEFTFHSTWGAGPESHQASTSQRHGTADLSWTYEPISLDCTPSDVQALSVGFVDVKAELMASATFSVSLQANAKDTTDPVSYPRWRVFVDTANDVKNANANGKTYSLRQGTGSIVSVVGEGADGILMSSLKAPNGATTFDYLYFEGASAPEVGIPEEMVITFRSVGNVYAASGGDGSRPISTKSYSCDAHISLEHVEAPAVVQSVEVTGVSGAENACPSGSSTCVNHYYTDIETFKSGGFEVTVTFYNTSGITKIVDTETVRNATIVTMGSLTTPRDSAPESWEFEQASSSFLSSDMDIHSTYNIPPLEKHNDITYTFGSLHVQALRERPNSEVTSNIESGVGKIKLQYAATATVNSPVRKAGFKICAASWDTSGLSEVTDLEICTVVYLTVIPLEKSISTFIEDEPAEGKKIRGSSPACGLSPTLSTIKVFAFYSIVSIPSTRFYVYDEPVRFSVRFAETQYLVLSGSTVTNISLLVDTGVPLTTDRLTLLDHSLLREELKSTLSFYGRDIAASEEAPRSLVVSGEHLTESSVSVTGATTTNLYWFANPEETFAQWDVSETVTLDDECPSKRYLQTVSSNYRTYSPNAGEGWKYTDGVAVGIPFPIQTLVTTTTNNNRAWTFTDTLVRVSKRSWERCNNGGTLKVYSMKPSLTSDGLVARNGDLTSFLLEQSGSAVKTNMGAAIAWPVFSEPCEHCTLQFDLCYTYNGDVSACLDGYGATSTDPSDKTPLYAGRTKITKPFSVKKVESTVMDIYEQTLPSIRGGSSDAHIQVGDLFSLTVENVQEFGTTTKWAMVEPSKSRWDRTIYVSSEWMDTPTNTYDNRKMRYGNGAFLSDGSTKQASTADLCADVSDAEFSGASYMPKLVDSGVVSFYFTRPCSKCRIMVDYTLSKAGWASKSAKFPLLSYGAATVGNAPGSVVEYNVRTCGGQWLLAGVPPVAVRRRKPFQLTVWRTDAHNMPDWDSTDASVSLTWNAASSQGNGAGAYAVPTSPAATAALTGKDTRSRDGSATVRLFITRACFKCSLSLSSKPHQLTVLTDPTQIIAIPASRTMLTQWFKNETEVGSWSFEVYAADDLGDRSYVVAGPTSFAFQPAYGIRQVSQGTLSLGVHSQIGYNAKMTGQDVELTSLLTGAPTQELATGERVFNGIPLPTITDEVASGEVGIATLKMSETPSVGYAVNFAITGVTGPTNYFGEKRPPLINFSPAASHMAIDDASKSGSGCQESSQMVVGQRCQFRAFTVARKPAAKTTDRSWYLSVSPMTQPATADAVCTSVANVDAVDVCSVSIGTGSANFVGGIATFWVEATKATEECTCVVTVTPPSDLELNATAQSFTVGLKPQTTLSKWDWSMSSTLPIVTASSSRKTAKSVYNRTVVIGLTAWDSEGAISGLGGLGNSWASGRVVTVDPSAMDPASCFTCSSETDGTCAVTVSEGGDSAELSGYFKDIGSCTLNSGAIGGLPIIAADGSVTLKNPESTLDVTVEGPTKLKIVSQYHRNWINLETESNFSSLHGRTIDGEDAAVVGVGTTLIVSVLDSDDNAMLGDYHTEFTLRGTRDIGNDNTTEGLATTLGPFVGTAKGGSITFKIDSDDTTRLPTCVPTMGSCTHAPWEFTLEAAAPLLNGSTPFEGIDITEKLYFVRKGVKLSSVAMLDGESKEITGGKGPVHWVYGFPFDMTVTAYDVTGTVVTHPEDLGSNAQVYLRPYAIPCLDNDAKLSTTKQSTKSPSPYSNVYDTCITGGGACNHDTFSQLTCGAAGWSFDGMSSSIALEAELQEGKKVLQNVVYKGVHDGEKRFLLTTTGFELKQENNNNYDSMFAKDDSFLGEIMMQRIVGISLDDPENGVKCPAGVCAMPSGWPEVTEPLTKFNITVAVVDVAGDVVVGDSESTVMVTSSCASSAHIGFIGKGQTSDGLLDTLTPIKQKAVNGLIVFEDLEFSNDCPNMTLSFSCASGEKDTVGDCNGKTFETVKFNVTNTGMDVIPTPPTPKEILVGLVMGKFTAEQFVDYVANFDAALFEGTMGSVIGKDLPTFSKCILEFVCLLEEFGVITDEMRADPARCKRFNEMMMEMEENPANRFVQQLAEGELVAKAEFQVLTTVYGDPATVTDIVTKAVAEDTAKDESESIIKSSSPDFRNVNGTSITIGAKDTPSPTPIPTPVPPPTPRPPTPEPPVPTPEPPTSPPANTSEPSIETLPPDSSAMLSPSMLSVLLSVLAVMMVTL
eukprot:TRINITY_DN14_c0_g3_i1.p1 TRINITY_DN14_c0_g3~~TRINITY_DN14_c0_g3_i1.p1  ORF type:complete len:4482 (+),score=859.73 TRINITY_DN14_c0_g3_i1:81-13526(+)